MKHLRNWSYQRWVVASNCWSHRVMKQGSWLVKLGSLVYIIIAYYTLFMLRSRAGQKQDQGCVSLRIFYGEFSNTLMMFCRLQCSVSQQLPVTSDSGIQSSLVIFLNLAGNSTLSLHYLISLGTLRVSIVFLGPCTLLNAYTLCISPTSRQVYIDLHVEITAMLGSIQLVIYAVTTSILHCAVRKFHFAPPLDLLVFSLP